MLALSPHKRYYLYFKPCDMRKGFDGLCGIVRNEFKQDPFTGDLFIFLNRRRTHIKILLWENDGFSIYYKRLEKGTYELPLFTERPDQVSISRQQLHLILEGICLASVRKRKRYKTSSYS